MFFYYYYLFNGIPLRDSFGRSETKFTARVGDESAQFILSSGYISMF